MVIYSRCRYVAAADRRLLYHSSPVCSQPTHLHVHVRRLRPVVADTDTINQSINIRLLRHDKMQANNRKQTGNTVSKKKAGLENKSEN